MRRRFLAACFFFAGLHRVWAHDPGLSTAQVEIQGSVIVVGVTFSTADLAALHPPAVIETEWIRGFFQLSHRNANLRADGASVQPAPTPGEYQFQLIFPRAGASGDFILRALRLGELPPGHRQYIAVTDAQGGQLVEKLLTVEDAGVAFAVAPAIAGPAPLQDNIIPTQSRAAVFWGFLRLGITHIGTGYDHLMFLLGLLLVCRTVRSVVRIVTCFTLAHSLTLALATFNIVHLSNRLVAPAIALSILYVGLENLWRRGAEPPGRWAVTFIFGLIHGFGFTTVLRDMGVGTTRLTLALPLFSFNLGVELGQLVVALALLPVLWQLRKNPRFVQVGVPVLSGLVALAGLYWLVERIWFG